jgi:hypothetical protein
LEATGPRAIALRGDQLVVLTQTPTLDVYAVADGELLHSWSVPAGTKAAVDVHYGIAVVTAGREVIAINLATGRRRVLVETPQPARAQVDDIGVVYVYNTRRGGVLGFLSFAEVERVLAN